MTTVTLPISTPCVTAPSARSAKNSMYTKITTEITDRTSHKGVGMIPSAPWTRSMRACSRSAVWSIHRSYADCSVGVFGSTVEIVRNISAPHGLMEFPSVPRVQRIPLDAGHGPCVADQLAGELRAVLVGQELGRLDLLRHDRRLGLGARAATGRTR